MAESNLKPAQHFLLSATALPGCAKADVQVTKESGDTVLTDMPVLGGSQASSPFFNGSLGCFVGKSVPELPFVPAAARLRWPASTPCCTPTPAAGTGSSTSCPGASASSRWRYRRVQPALGTGSRTWACGEECLQFIVSVEMGPFCSI